MLETWISLKTISSKGVNNSPVVLLVDFFFQLYSDI